MKEGRGLPQRRGVLRLVPAFLFDIEQPKPAYVAKAWLVSFVPSLLVAALVASLAAAAESPPIAVDGAWAVLLLVLVVPFLETLIMVPPLLLLERMFGPALAVFGSATGWAVAHSLVAPTWGLSIWWPFVVFSAALLAWRRRGWGVAILIVTAIHGCQNGVPALILLLGATG